MSIGLGTEIGGYRVTRPIGEGGMSIVYLADRIADGRQVVLKVLREELAKNEDFRRRFLRESGYAASLDQAHVVPVHDAGESDGVLYIAMEYIQGTDLYALLAAGPLAPELTVAILTQVASALDAAHEIGLLHRDVKPGNVLVASSEEAEGVPHCYLTDFGLSKHTEKDSVALTASGDFVGTVYYTAPEQMLGKALDGRVDVYSLGCLLYECLVGETPFTGSTDVEVMQAHVERAPPKVSTSRPDLPWALDEVIAKAMAKDPGERYESCGELMAAARSVVGVAGLAAVAGGSGSDAAAAPGKLRLKVTEGNATGREIQVENEFLIGRQAPGDGKLNDDIEISRQHARISRTDSGFVVEDLGSTNGTLVNGRRISAPEPLYPGDKLQLGDTTLVVQVSTEGMPASAAPDATAETTGERPRPQAPARLSLRLEVDLEGGEALLELEGAEPVRLVHEDGRWQMPPPA